MVVNIQAPLAEDYPLTQADIAQYQKDGHILLKKVVPPSEIDELRTVVLQAHQALIDEEEDFQKAFRCTQNLWEVNNVVRLHVLSRRYAGIAAKLLGCRDVRVYHDLTFFKDGQGRGAPTPWHQDGYYWPLDTNKCITLWVPLIDCPLEMGPMSFVSGSHLTRNAEHLEISNASDEFINDMIEKENLTVTPARHMNAGDATFHSCWTYHAAKSNTTDTMRIAFAIAYFDADATIPLHPPTNERRAKNLARWFPRAVPGGPAATEINPAVLAMYGSN
ncbi:hypothetical protein SCLCIDRAFT_31028 [Scleroderma citrinum Foug A]|uniref:Phytanoyl-CoA dioxygenase family protein n=1 Tax=Scleroderma citrinum Foug A TaxID=1036808 RepID=A0A0C3DEI6_9AGAM|nr:hypothetical protein SCLCIDRAFT_31028 [Scleroderma citrinum Foug A]